MKGKELKFIQLNVRKYSITDKNGRVGERGSFEELEILKK